MKTNHLLADPSSDARAEPLLRSQYAAKVVAARPAEIFPFDGDALAIGQSLDSHGEDALGVGPVQVRECPAFCRLTTIVAQAAHAPDKAAARAVLAHADKPLAVLSVAADAADRILCYARRSCAEPQTRPALDPPPGDESREVVVVAPDPLHVLADDGAPLHPPKE